VIKISFPCLYIAKYFLEYSRLICSHVAQDNNNVLGRLKLWICSGETLSVTLADQFFTTFSNHESKILANFYGSTEVMGDVTYYLLNNHAQLQKMEKVPIGKNNFYLLLC
jgi:non-ribosomal peptide synthetase component F